MKQKTFLWVLFLLALPAAVWPLCAQGTAFVYQGRLFSAGVPANTNFDFRFTVFNAVTSGNAISVPLTNSAVPVSNGLFSVTLDFGPGVFTGSNCWLDIGVRTNGLATGFTALTPRQPVLPTPYAIFATTASNLVGSLAATQLVGTLPSSQISGNYSNSVSFTNAGNIFSGTFAGSGTNLVNLNATQLTGGTVADARLSTNVALLNANQKFTGSNYFTSANTFTNRSNSFIGSFFGNGLVGWIPVSGTATQAMSDAGYLLTNSAFTTVTLPTNSPSLLVGDIVRISGAGAGGWQVLPNPGQSIIGNFNSYRSSTISSSGNGGDWHCIAAGASGAPMYAAGNGGGQVYSSLDFGHTWNQTGIGSGGGWYAVACSADGTTVYVGSHNSSGVLMMSTNGGATFPTTLASSYNFTSLDCSSDGVHIVAAIGGGGVQVWSNTVPFGALVGAFNWTAVASSANGFKMAAAYTGGSIYTSTNAGVTWTSTGSPSYNWTALVASADGAKLVGSANGGIYTSTNFGAIWNTNSAPVANYTCLAGSADCSRLVAGVSNGMLYASANFGATWTTLTTTNQQWTGVAMSADGSKFAGTCGYVGGSGGGIFYSGVNLQTSPTTNSIVGSLGSAVELQYIGNNQFMPVSSVGTIWAN